VIVALNDFVEEGWAILNWGSEDLEQVTLVIEVDENLELLQDIEVLLN